MMLGCNSGQTWRRIRPGSVGVEIGVWRGDTSAKFLRSAGWLHLVDPWSVTAYEQSDEFGDYQAYLRRYSKLVGSADPRAFQRYYNQVYAEVVARFDGCPVTIHRMTSAEFFDTFKQRVDWVYVDGSHSHAGCLADLRGALGIVRSGGQIYGDDYGNKPGVTSAVDEFVREAGFADRFQEFGYHQYAINV